MTSEIPEESHHGTDAASALKQLKALQQTKNPEQAHEEADDILCKLIEADGHKDIATAFRLIPKWYA